MSESNACPNGADAPKTIPESVWSDDAACAPQIRRISDRQHPVPVRSPRCASKGTGIKRSRMCSTIANTRRREVIGARIDRVARGEAAVAASGLPSIPQVRTAKESADITKSGRHIGAGKFV
ncbi:MAG: hypothetical protein WAK88_01300 [Candidatus Cybelea sp.]